MGIIASAASCSRSQSRYNHAINEAEKAMNQNADSALTMLDAIDPSDLKADSLRAKYHYLRALGHMRMNRSMIADSLMASVHDYYSGKDIVRDMRSATVYAWYKFWIGDMTGAIAMLDSIISLNDVPDSLMVESLRVRNLLGASEYEGKELIPMAKRLIELETDPKGQIEAKYILLSSYENAGEIDSALMLTNELMDYARENRLGELHFNMMYERAQILTELERYRESDIDIDYIFKNAGAENGAADYLHMHTAMNALNSGDTQRAARELAKADSLAAIMRSDDDAYYHSYSNLLRTMIEFKQTGKMKLKHVNGLNNRQRERFNRMEASQWESERGALEQQSRALALKAESQHKTVIILIIALVSVVMLAGAGLIIRRRRQRELENEERAEALQKMVDELKSAPPTQPSEGDSSAALRRALLQQLGIIKMVAETPTEQNREMLRKISSIDGETNGELVNWDNVYDLIDNLYSGFYSRLTKKHGDALTPKEIQIIVLMMADFSTKEISVITRQTTATIYVRKSSIRKKLGVAEKEDIIAFLRSQLSPV